jgi:hypothetical protein
VDITEKRLLLAASGAFSNGKRREQAAVAANIAADAISGRDCDKASSMPAKTGATTPVLFRRSDTVSVNLYRKDSDFEKILTVD